MAKNKRSKQPVVEDAAKSPLLVKSGWRLLLIGAASVVLGFIVLSFTDSAGQNAASHISPFLIVGGYALIGIGLMKKTVT